MEEILYEMMEDLVVVLGVVEADMEKWVEAEMDILMEMLLMEVVEEDMDVEQMVITMLGMAVVDALQNHQDQEFVSFNIMLDSLFNN